MRIEKGTMTITKAAAQAVANELEVEIKKVLALHGMEVSNFSTKYGAWFEMKLAASPLLRGANGVNLNSPEAEYFTRYGYRAYGVASHGVELTAPLGTLFESKGETYAFAGIAAKRRKFPIVGRNIEDGSIVFFTEALITRLNAAAAPAAV